MLLIPVGTVYLHYASQCDKSGFFQSTDVTQLIALISLSLIFAGSYVINQIFDIESDRLNDKLHFLPNGMISVKTAVVFYIALNLIGLMLAYYLGSTPFIMGLLVFILGLLYSLPKVRLKDSSIGGLLVNGIAYGLLIPGMIRFDCNPELNGLLAIPYFLAIVTGYILTTIPDLAGDALTDKKTVAVILGPKLTLILAFLTSLATAVVSIYCSNYEMALVAVVTSGLILYLHYSYSDRLILFTCKFPILLLTILAGLHFPAYLGFLLLTIILTKLYYKKRFGIVYPRMG